MRTLKLLLPLLLLLLPLGCQVPDVNPFAQATTEMTSVLSEALDYADTQMSLAAKQVPDDQQKADLREKQQRLRQQAAAIQEGLDAFDAYAATLVEVADANAKGKETINKAADALAAIGTALGPSVSLSVKGAAEAVKAISGYVQTIRTLNTLKQAVQPADAAIQRARTVLEAGFVELARIDSVAVDIQEVALTNQNQYVLGPYKGLQERQSQADSVVSYIVAFQNVAYRPVSKRRTLRLAELLKSIRKADRALPPTPPDTTMVAARRLGQTLDLLSQREAFWQARATAPNRLQPRYTEVQAQLAALQTSASQRRGVFSKSLHLLRVWGRAHAALKTAVVKQSRTVSFQEVVRGATDLQALLDKLKAKKN